MNTLKKIGWVICFCLVPHLLSAQKGIFATSKNLLDACKEIHGTANRIDSTVKDLNKVVSNAGTQVNRINRHLDTTISQTLDKTQNLVDRATRDINLVGDKYKGDILDIKESLLSRQTREWVRDLINKDVMGDETFDRLNLLKKNLIGNETKAQVDSLIASAVRTAGNSYKADLLPQFKASLQDATDATDTVKKQLKEALIVGGIVVLVLLIVGGYIAYRAYLHKKTLETLTYQIHNMDNQTEYDKLVANIQKDAQHNHVENHLKKILGGQGMLGPTAWRPS